MSGWNPASHHEHPQMNPQVRKALQFRVFPTYPSHVSYAELHRVKRVQCFPYSPLARQLCWASSCEACSGFSLLIPRPSAMLSFIVWSMFRVFPTHPSHVSYAELHRVKRVQSFPYSPLACQLCWASSCETCSARLCQWVLHCLLPGQESRSCRW